MNPIETSTNSAVCDYRKLDVGCPVGRQRIIACPACGANGLQVKGTKSVAHVIRTTHFPSGAEKLEVLVKCKGAVKKEAESPRNTGFPWCPKEWL